MSSTNRQNKLPLLLPVGIGVALVAVLFIAFWPNRDRGTDDVTVIPATTLAVPESSDTAKQYIDRASAQADKQEYEEAIKILNQGLEKFPDDENLKLTKEYYENEQPRYDE